MLNVDEIRAGLHTQSFTYSTKKYPFKELISSLFGVKLEELHKYLGVSDKNCVDPVVLSGFRICGDRRGQVSEIE